MNSTVGRTVDLGTYNGAPTAANFIDDIGNIVGMTADEEVALVYLPGEGWVSLEDRLPNVIVPGRLLVACAMATVVLDGGETMRIVGWYRNETVIHPFALDLDGFASLRR